MENKMINYDKWKLLNENFMISQPLGGIKSNNGFLAYNKLHEDEDMEDVEEIEDEDEDMEDEDMEDEDMEDEDMEDEDMEDEDMEDEDMEDEDMEDEDMEDEDMEDEDMEDEDMDGNMMGRVRSIHHPDAHNHHKHMHHRPHHEMDVDEIDFANAAADKYSKMYASCESMDYKLPPMNEWLASVNGQMFPEQLQEYIGKKDVQINEAVEEKLTGALSQLNRKIDTLASRQSITRVEFISALRHFVQTFENKVTGGLPTMADKRLDQVLDEFAKTVEEGESDSDKEKPSKMKHMKKGKDGCGYSMPMMAKKSKSECGYMGKGEVHPKHMKMSKKKMGKGCMDSKMKGHMKSHMKKGWKG
jgi:hypothetical protein